MTTRTKATDADALRDEARKLIEQATAAQQRVNDIDAKEAAKLFEAQAGYDRQVVDGYRSQPYEQAVTDARRRLDEVVSADPLTRAVADFLYAQQARSFAFSEFIGALGRLGQPTAGAQPPPSVDALGIGEYVGRAADDIAADRVNTDRVAAHNARNETETNDDHHYQA